MAKMAILCGVLVPEHSKSFLSDEGTASDGLEFTSPYYGVSRKFLWAHDHINDLLARLPSATLLGDTQDLDSVELQMYLDLPGHDMGGTTIDPTHAGVIQYTSWVFLSCWNCIIQEVLTSSAGRSGPRTSRAWYSRTGVPRTLRHKLVGMHHGMARPDIRGRMQHLIRTGTNGRTVPSAASFRVPSSCKILLPTYGLLETTLKQLPNSQIGGMLVHMHATPCSGYDLNQDYLAVLSKL
jgi:hypothetical protein